MPEGETKDKEQAERDREILLNAPELSIWMVAFGCLSYLIEIRIAYANDHIDSKTFYPRFNEGFAEFIDTADATSRFGVVMPVVAEANFRRRMKKEPNFIIDAKFSSFFWKWYNWWDDYLGTLTKEQRERLRQLGMDRLPEIEHYRPPGDWINYRSDPPPVLTFSASP